MIKNDNINQIRKAVRDKKNLSVFSLPFYSRMIAMTNVMDELGRNREFVIERNALSKKHSLSDGNTFEVPHSTGAHCVSLLYICADFVKAKEALVQFNSIKNNAVYLPAVPDVLLMGKGSKEILHERCLALYKIACQEAEIVVSTVQAFMQWYPSRDEILTNSFSLQKGACFDLDELVKKLINAGYERVSQLDEPGQFSLKGDILDIWVIGQEAVRVDFFGDDIEAIRVIDIDSFRAGGSVDRVSVVPCSGSVSAKQIALLKFVDGITVFDEAKQCVDNFNAHLSEHESRFKSLLLKGEIDNSLINTLNKDALNIINHNYSLIAFDKQLCQNRIFKPDAVLDIKNPELMNYAKDKDLLTADIKMWLRQGVAIDIYADGALKNSTAELLVENGLPPSIVKQGTLYKGGCFFNQASGGQTKETVKDCPDKHGGHLINVSTGQILIGYGDLTYKRKTGETVRNKKNKKTVFFQPKVGEAVVHEVHGVGMCHGLERKNFGGVEKDFCVISYEGGDKLYVAVEGMSRLNAYAGSEDAVRLNKIGGADFSRQKEKVKKSIKEFSLDLKALYSKRESIKGHAYDPSNAALREFEQDFPYDETSCQLSAVEEGLTDLIQGKIMDRLLCGDVGYGKTEVAMRLMYKVVLENKQAALISPTTILAKQHYETLKKRMVKHGVNIGSLTRFDSTADIKKTIEGLKKGTIDIVCGTHRVLSKDVEFKTLGLLVLDEEQRFGVADKDKIKTFKNDVNVLSLSATPIPRTLHMSMSGIRDISTLDTPPRGRIPISTYVSEYTENLVYDAVTREIGRGGQVFIVYNRVEKIDGFASGIVSLLPDLKIAVAHGQMKESVLEDIINRFVKGEIDILISSTIIENGIDMPNANTMIVVDADKLGLSQLYQLRGRIGRSDRLAYAFFTFDGSKMLTENAYKRLDAISGYTDFGAGFKLAMRDLEIRGAGNVLGREQSGHMQRVGYDMYLKLIEEVMDEISGKIIQTKVEAKVNTDFSALIPIDYIEDIEVRMREYKRVAEVGNLEAAGVELERLKDIYGVVPVSTRNLVFVSLIKNLAEGHGAIAVNLTKQKVSIKFSGAVGVELLKKAAMMGFEFNANDNTLVIRSSADVLTRVMKLLKIEE